MRLNAIFVNLGRKVVFVIASRKPAEDDEVCRIQRIASEAVCNSICLVEYCRLYSCYVHLVE
jgi:hypothetical protein